MLIGSGGASLDGASIRVVSGAAILLAISFGTAYTIPVFFPIVISELKIPSWHLTALFSATGALYYSLGPIAGFAVDRKGARHIAMFGQFALAAALSLMGFGSGELLLGITSLIGVGLGVGLCFVPAMTAVQVTCQKCPAVAGGLAAAGIGAGILIEPPLVQRVIDYLGWRAAFQIMSVIAMCGAFAALLLPNSASTNRSGKTVISSPRLPHLKAAFKDGSLPLLYMASALISMAAFVPFAHFVLFSQARGFLAETGVALISLAGLGSLCGRCLFGCVAQSLGCCRSSAVCCVTMAGALAGLIVFSDSWGLRVDVILFGLGYGGSLGLLAPAVAEVSGVAGIGRSLGWVATSRAVGMLLGPWAVGAVAFRLSSYDMPFVGCALLAVTASLLFYRLHCRLSAATG